MLSSAKLLPHGRGPAPRVRFLFSAAVWEDEDAGLGPREECVTPHRFGDLLSLLNMPATLEEKTNVLRTQLGLEADFPSAVVIGLAIAHLLDHGSTRAHLGVRSGCALSEGGLHVA